MSSGSARRESIFSTFSTSTTLTARIKLVEWLKVREGTWGISKWRKGAITVSIVFVIWNVTHSSILVVFWNSVQIEQLTNGAPETVNINEGEEQELANTALQAHLAPLDTKKRRQQALLKLLNTERAYSSDLELVQSVHMPLALGLNVQLGGEIIGLGQSPSTASSTVTNGTSTNTLSITSSLGSGLSISGASDPSNPLVASTSTQALATGTTDASSSTTDERQSPSPAKNEPPMTEDDVRMIFRNIEQLAIFADGFADEIETAFGAEIPGGIGADRVGELFVKRVSSVFFSFVDAIIDSLMILDSHHDSYFLPIHGSPLLRLIMVCPARSECYPHHEAIPKRNKQYHHGSLERLESFVLAQQACPTIYYVPAIIDGYR